MSHGRLALEACGEGFQRQLGRTFLGRLEDPRVPVARFQANLPEYLGVVLGKTPDRIIHGPSD